MGELRKPGADAILLSMGAYRLPLGQKHLSRGVIRLHCCVWKRVFLKSPTGRLGEPHGGLDGP